MIVICHDKTKARSRSMTAITGAVELWLFFFIAVVSSQEESSRTPELSPYDAKDTILYQSSDSNNYLYQSSDSHFWSFVGCYGLDFAVKDDIYVRNAIATDEYFRGSLYDCTLWAIDLNLDTIGMFNNGSCWGHRGGKLAIMGTKLTNPHTVGIGSIEMGGGNEITWMPCVYRLITAADLSLTITTSAAGADDIKRRVSLFNSPLEEMRSAIYSTEARNQLFSQYYGSSDDINICIASFSKEFVEAPLLHPFCPKLTDIIGFEHSKVQERQLPEYLVRSTLNHRISIIDFYNYEESWESSAHVEWTDEYLEQSYKKGYCFGSRVCNYCSLNCESLFEKYSDYLTNKIGVVIGSSTPWLESSIIKAGINHLFTVEYRHILSKVSSLTTFHPKQLASLMRSNAWVPVDVAFSFSSIEHSGLGRYGDPLHAQGDLISINQIMCLIKPGGLLFLAVPVGTDCFVFNAHRIYGRHRLPLLLKGWDLVDVIGDFNFDQKTPIQSDSYTEPILILRKPL